MKQIIFIFSSLFDKAELNLCFVYKAQIDLNKVQTFLADLKITLSKYSNEYFWYRFHLHLSNSIFKRKMVVKFVQVVITVRLETRPMLKLEQCRNLLPHCKISPKMVTVIGLQNICYIFTSVEHSVTKAGY